MNQKLALRLLEQMGYAADVATNGREAVEAWRPPYDVVLMDVQMPELDGLEATRRIGAPSGGARPRIVAMTANAMAGDREACLAAGMDDYLAKPIRPPELAAALSRSRWRPVPEPLNRAALDELVEVTGGDRALPGRADRHVPDRCGRDDAPRWTPRWTAGDDAAWSARRTP